MRNQITPLLFVNMNNVDPTLVMDLASQLSPTADNTFVASIEVTAYSDEPVSAMGVIFPVGTKREEIEWLAFQLLAAGVPGYTCFFMDNEGFIQQANLFSFNSVSKGEEVKLQGVEWRQVAEMAMPGQGTLGRIIAAGKEWGINLNLDGEAC